MTADAIVAISAAVVACTQLVKWAGLRDAWGPLAVIGFSGVGVVIWLFSQATWPPVRTDTWAIFAGWLSVALSSAGVFGFTRAAAGAVTRATTPPADGAGSSATVTATAAPLYVVSHGDGGHVAFLTEDVPVTGAELTASTAQHVDGRAMVVTEPILCDSCGEHLQHVSVIGGDWVAVGAPVTPGGGA